MNIELKQEIECEKAILRKQMEDEKIARDSIIHNMLPTADEIIVEDVEFPINTNPDVLHTKFPHREYAHLTLLSNYDNLDNKYDKERYIYEDKISFVDIATALGNSRQTTAKNIKQLEKSGVIVKDPINPKVYKIKYSFEGKGDYILVHKDILKKLVDIYKSDVIAVYYWLCIRLRTGKNALLREWICEGVGLKPTSRNLDKISSITTSLENEGLIGKEIEYVVRRGQKKERVTYVLATYEQYKKGIFRIRKAMRDKEALEKKGILF